MAASIISDRIRIQRNVRIPTGEPGVTLSADVYLPETDEPVPALVTVSPYRKDASIGIAYDPSLRWYAARGYAAVLVDLLGTGSSDGMPRLPVDPGEVEDGLAALAWTAAQPWCDGSIGMWGQSYGAMTAMRTAAQDPEQLKAIVAIMGPIDPELDSIHPNGMRGGQCPVPTFGRLTLVDQLLPPVESHHSPEQQARWRARLDDPNPWIVDLFRHGPLDPAWRERVIDAAAIRVPALCVEGWRDMQLEGQVRAYELMQGPKQLLVGPWMHSHPQQDPADPIDFLSVALRWWDHWLRGVDNGVAEEPPVTLFIQGERPGWASYDAWPPSPDRLELGLDVSGEYRPDPTIGALAGLWSVGLTFGLPLDQGDDDRRSLCATGEPLAEDLLIVGRPKVVVHGSPAERLVIRLNDVDGDGRSAFVTSGVACGGEPVELYPTAYRVAAGHRVRVAVCDSEFPRLWPLADGPVLRVDRVELELPVVDAKLGRPADVPVADDRGGQLAGMSGRPIWRITREPLEDAIEVVSGAEWTAPTADGEHVLERHAECRATVRRDAPEDAEIYSVDRQRVRLAAGETLEAVVEVCLTSTALSARGEVTVDGETVFARSWDA
jgi:uncharacterized protein